MTTLTASLSASDAAAGPANLPERAGGCPSLCPAQAVADATRRLGGPR